MIFPDSSPKNDMPVLLHRAVLYLVNLSNHSIHYFPFEWTEHNGLVLDWIEHKPSAWLDHTCSNVVNSGDCNDKAISVGETHINTMYMSEISMQKC